MKKLNLLFFKYKKIIILIPNIIILAVMRICNISCVFKYLFNVPCPGCGFTHALIAFVKGDIASAFSYHPLFWTFPLIVIFYLKDGDVFKSKALNDAAMLSWLFALIIIWIIRLIL